MVSEVDDGGDEGASGSPESFWKSPDHKISEESLTLILWQVDRNQERTAGTISLGPSWLRRNHQIFSKYLLFSPPQGPNPQADASRGGDTPAGTRPFPVTHT